MNPWWKREGDGKEITLGRVLFSLYRVFGKFGYGFGLPKNSPYTEQFSVKILELQQKGFMQHLRERWLQGVCKTPYSESGGKKKSTGLYLKEILQLQQSCIPMPYLPYKIRFRCSSYSAKLAGAPNLFGLRFWTSTQRTGARFSKVPVTFRARNQIFKSKHKE